MTTEPMTAAPQTESDPSVERLRASKAEYEKTLHDEGLRDGYEWAKDDAAYPELKRLNRWWDNTSESDRWTVLENYDNNSARCNLAEIITGNRELDRIDERGFWESAVGDADDDRLEEGTFVGAFAEGALKRFGEVEGKL